MTFLIHRLIEPADGDTPRLAALDRGFQLGDGVFDTLVAFGGKAFARERHLARLLRAAEAIGIPADRDAIAGTIADVMTDVGDRHAVIRTTLTRGRSARGLWPTETPQPTLLVTAQPWAETLLGQPARLAIATAPRNERSPLSRLKSLAYLDNILAAREAAKAGADDAIILNTAGRVACTTIANVFALRGDRLLTPPLADGCLDGIVRGLVMEKAGALGLQTAELSLDVGDLLSADAVFLTNSVRLLRPVTAIGETPAQSSPITGAILERLLHRVAGETGARLKTPLPHGRGAGVMV